MKSFIPLLLISIRHVHQPLPFLGESKVKPDILLPTIALLLKHVLDTILTLAPCPVVGREAPCKLQMLSGPKAQGTPRDLRYGREEDGSGGYLRAVCLLSPFQYHLQQIPPPPASSCMRYCSSLFAFGFVVNRCYVN